MGTDEHGSAARVVVEVNGSTPKRIIIFTRESGMRDRSLCDCFKPRLIPTGPFKAIQVGVHSHEDKAELTDSTDGGGWRSGSRLAVDDSERESSGRRRL